MKAWKIIVLVIVAILLVATLVGVVFSVKTTIKNHNGIISTKKDLTALVGENTSDITEVKKSVTDADKIISDNTELINELTDIVSDNTNAIGENQNQIANNLTAIDNNATAITNLSEAQKELRSVVTVHGWKVNRVVKLVFEGAYGKDNVGGHKKWDQYTRCGNKKLWDEAIQKLNLSQVQKLLEMDKIEKKISEHDKKFGKIKPKAFKRR